MATLNKDTLNQLKANDVAGYNQIAVAGIQAKANGGDIMAAMQDKYNSLYGTLQAQKVEQPQQQYTQLGASQAPQTQNVVQNPITTQTVTATPQIMQMQAQSQPQTSAPLPAVQTPTQVPIKPITTNGVTSTGLEYNVTTGLKNNIVTPQPIKEAQESLKKGGVQDVTAQRANEIMTNLNEGYRNDPDVKNAIDTGNWEQFKSRYNVQSPEEAKIVQAYFQARQPKDKYGILNILMSGQNIYNPEITKSPEYSKAQLLYNTLNQYASANGNTINSIISNGTILEGSKEYNALKQLNPKGVSEYETIKKNKDISNNINSYATGLFKSGNAIMSYDKNKSVESQSSTPTQMPDILQQLSDSITKNTTPNFAEEWKQKISENPEVVAMTKDVNSIKGKIDKLSIDETYMEDTVKAELAGTGASQDYIDAKMRTRLKDIYKEKSMLSIELNTKSNILTALTQNAKDELDLEMKQYQIDEEKNKELRGYAFDVYKTQQAQAFEQQQQDIAYARELKQQDIAFEREKALNKIQQDYQTARDNAQTKAEMDRIDKQFANEWDLTAAKYEADAKLAGLKSDTKEPKTTTAGGKTFQYNPVTDRYDIEVGGGAGGVNGEVNNKGYNNDWAVDYAKYNSGKMNSAEKKQALADNPQFREQAAAYGVEQAKKGIPAIDDTITKLQAIRDIGKFTRQASQVGGGLINEDAAKFKNYYDNIVSGNSLQNLIDLKSQGATFGALSDNELQFIKSASSAGLLGTNLSDTEWQKQIDAQITKAKQLKQLAEGNINTEPVGGKILRNDAKSFTYKSPNGYTYTANKGMIGKTLNDGKTKITQEMYNNLDNIIKSIIDSEPNADKEKLKQELEKNPLIYSIEFN